MLRLLFPCCIRPIEDEFTIIPDETSYLLPASVGLPSPDPSDTITVDHQKLNDRLSTIVRAKEGKMVNVISRTPFTLHIVQDSTSSSDSRTAPLTPTSPTTATGPVLPVSPASSDVVVSRRPTVLTMTPARSRATMSLYADSRYSSPSASRSSSRRRPDPADRYMYAAPSSDRGSVRRKGKQASTSSEWFGETESDTTGDRTPDEVQPPAPGVMIASPVSRKNGPRDVNVQSIAFSWSDT
ncbi:hypothetical protein B0H17DRAFT_1330682 [Mycena rosella]|uniref:Uncharacterized protein n=1 Tax=Mycena rosella TaxID=1033263 RepID=A0AAD7DJX1_MYCRO|nr:hypothetical protein B0H17DRAFT_1330682 [Mycena rosella]